MYKKRVRDRFLAAIALGVAAFATAACVSHDGASVVKSALPAASASAGNQASARKEDPKLGLSYEAPTGYAATSSGDNDGYLVTFKPQGPKADEAAILLAAVRASDPTIGALLPHMNMDGALDYFRIMINEESAFAVQDAQKVTWESSGLSGGLLAAKGHDMGMNPEDGIRVMALLVKGDQRWLLSARNVLVTKNQFPDLPGGAAEALARSIKPL